MDPTNGGAGLAGLILSIILSVMAYINRKKGVKPPEDDTK